MWTRTAARIIQTIRLIQIVLSQTNAHPEHQQLEQPQPLVRLRQLLIGQEILLILNQDFIFMILMVLIGVQPLLALLLLLFLV